MKITKISIVFLLLVMISCGDDVEIAPKNVENQSINLESYGLNASIMVADAEVIVIEKEDKYEHQLLAKKSIEIKTKENLILLLNESQENGVAMKVEFAEGFGEVVVEKGENFCIIEQEDEDGNKVYDVSVFHKKGDSFLEIKVIDPETKQQCATLEVAKKGLEMAKTFKFS